MAKSIQELLQLQKAARAVPTRLVPAIDWALIVERLMKGETLVFKADCKFSLPKGHGRIEECLRDHGYTGRIKVRHPLAEIIMLDPMIDEDQPVVERNGRKAETGIAPAPVKRGPGRPRKNPLAAMGNTRH
jgi:hypothetical protein